jgi:hypothetical protein
VLPGHAGNTDLQVIALQGEMEAPMSPERQAAPRGQVAIEPLSPERAEPGFAAMSIEGVTPERPTASPPADPARGRAPPDPTDSIVWFPAGDVRAIDIRDAVEHPAQFVRPRTHARTHAPHRPAHWLSSLSPAGTQELTADGNRKKKKRTPLNQIGARVRVNELEVTLFRVGGILFAAQEACKHMGGPLSLGDIEVSAPATTQARLPHGL